MSTFTLDDIKAAAERKHGSTTIDLPTRRLVLRNALSLDDEQYAELSDLQEQMSKLDETPDPEATPGVESAAGDVLVPAVPGAGTLSRMKAITGRCLEIFAGGPVDDLLDALEHDLPRMLTVMENHAAGTQLGEAERSAS